MGASILSAPSMFNDAGFRPQANGSGLYVPEAHVRERKVVTYAEWKAIDKALGILNRLGLRFQFRCDKPHCSAIEKRSTPDGGTVLRCDHADRVFTKAF